MAPAGGTLGPGRGRGHGQTPALSAALDGRQIAASNSTLNAWVGRRQPSWLANATPVQPTPRPARPPLVTIAAAATTAAATTTASFAAIPATETASFQPQPQPKPQSQSQSRSQLQPHPSARPPQAPPQAPLRQSQHNQPLQTQPSLPSPRPPVPSLPVPSHSQPPPQAGPLRLSISLADHALLSPAPSDEPSPSLSLLPDSLDTRNPCSNSSRNGPPITEAHFELDNHANPDRFASPQSRDLASPAHNGENTAPQGTTQAQATLAASSTEDMALHTPSPNVTGVGHIGSVQEDASGSIASKRRRVDNKFLAFLEAHRAQIQLNEYLHGLGGESNLDETVERPRFVLLTKACRDGDLFFVALHQLFCSWTASQASVHGLCNENVHDTSLVDHAFGIMGTILKANSKLREPLLRWFANFPVPLPASRLDQIYAGTINQVLDFLICVACKWTLVNHDHLMKGYPLLMCELINTFCLYSPTLQSIVFRASRRTLGAADNPIGIRLDELFRLDQEKHRNPDDGTYSLRLEGVVYGEHNNRLIQNYQSLIARCKRTSHARSSHSPSILPPSTAHSSAVSSPSVVDEHSQAESTQGFRPAPPAISTGRIVPSIGQNILTPSPTYSPVAPPQPMVIPQTPATLAPQFAVIAPRVLSSNSTVGMVQSPYPSPNVAQQGLYGAPNLHTQQLAQQQHLEQLRQQHVQHHLFQQQRIHQQQQQQLQQHQQQLEWQYQQHQQQQAQQQAQQQFQQLRNAQRKRSQPGAAPSPRPSPAQVTRSLPSQVHSSGQLSPQFQNSNNHPVSSATYRNLATPRGPQHSAHQSDLVDLSISHQPVNATQPTNVCPRPLVGLQRQPSQVADRLIPIPGVRIGLQDYPHTPYEKRSIDQSLHQAHLRSPRRMLKTLSAAPPERYYQAVTAFALEPTPIPPQPYLHEFTFSLTDTTLEKLTLNETIAGEVLPVNRFSNGSLRIRARCCFQSKTEYISQHVWVTSETTWPGHVFMSLNDKIIEVKRKQHHSKDLPVELSSFVQLGVNTLSISVPAQDEERKQQTPYLAVEIVEVLSHSAIVQMVHSSGSRPASETREVIQKRLAGSVSNLGGDDDDLEMANDGISIDLADPFTATIFEVPVRGKACKHLECFDLENWLNTRLGKKSPCNCGDPRCKCPKEPSYVDKWKCPFCDGDARPYSLYIDEYLVEVRARLRQANQLRTKSITVYADGSWKANDPAGDDDSDTESDDNGARATSKAISRPSIPQNVIELDDE
ncbi:hypothetical protein F4678DRAFT_486665 [Xylaria arbuscula]|nr:hypothetical protein F4678DRAFT_486665 [Xylaria arbuscula]